MEWLLGVPAIILLVLGLVGQGFEMRKMRLDTDEVSSQNIFTDKRNFKWYGMIGLGILLWYMAERM